ncbi:hypothetical protein A5849_001136, partial [Enterococcus sp. 10F3_DIV0382]
LALPYQNFVNLTHTEILMQQL